MLGSPLRSGQSAYHLRSCAAGTAADMQRHLRPEAKNLSMHCKMMPAHREQSYNGMELITYVVYMPSIAIGIHQET